MCFEGIVISTTSILLKGESSNILNFTWGSYNLQLPPFLNCIAAASPFLFSFHLTWPKISFLPCPYCKPLVLPCACKHARQMGMQICWPSQVKREEEEGRGSYKFLQFLTLSPKAQMHGVTFHFSQNKR